MSRKSLSLWTLVAAAAVFGTASIASAAAVGVDGSIGSEWSSVTPVHVLYNPSAPTGNFGAPTNENASVAYDIYVRGDANYLYVGIQTLSPVSGLDFANLYFDTNPPAADGSDLGFEVTNNRAFIPGGSGYTNYTAGADDITFSLTAGTGSTNGVLEFAVPFTFLINDPLGMGFPHATPGSYVTLRLSQSFGYSVAGGATYGADRLGRVDIPSTSIVPLPTSALSGLGLLAGICVCARLGRRKDPIAIA